MTHDLAIKKKIFCYEVKEFFVSGRKASYLDHVPELFNESLLAKFNIVTDVLNSLMFPDIPEKEQFQLLIERYLELLSVLVQLEHHGCYTDHLTGLFNFNYLKTLEHELNKKDFTLYFFDIDNMKQANDTFGHEYGNDMIVSFAKALKQSFRLTDLLFRYGGDEFIVIILRDDIDIDDVILRVRNQACIQKYNLSFSVGRHVNETSSLLKTMHQADSEMYERKKNK
ncbi:putative diguanylate cyclase YdaM [Vibrio aerogenes CECT 7868]|uniref:diguanylate cyclase n=1 Tax=Vibrio aerogenes CECT 7868 TaxID=1216006 RepID=A0A1M5VJQ8_9VIBR|nr:GGDEF domain-containing protein [Vibrio aerogenes]SHH75471.1 putative diguanylate cyclase YdaM [Vibrio aerogenes CECT 7868]